MRQLPSLASDSLDPANWEETSQLAHRMLEGALDHLQGLGDRPVWRPMPNEVRAEFCSNLPEGPSSLSSIYQTFLERIQPFTLHNSHPGFMGWVQGGGNPAGMLAELLAGALNANLGGRDQSPVELEKEVVGWMRHLFDFPDHAGGLFVTGSSMANFLSILVARNEALQQLSKKARTDGMLQAGIQLTSYTSAAVHRCVAQAMDMTGIGSQWLRKIPVDENHRIDLIALRHAIELDLQRGYLPFCIIGCAGTVDVGAIDNLHALRAIADEFQIWFHVDGAFAALGLFSSDIAPKLAGIQQADSIAFDFHKWAQVPYDAGFLLVRDGSKQLASFENPADYLSREPEGMSAGSPWPCDIGPDLSRGFRALKTWMTLKHYGVDKIGQIMARHCQLAQYLAAQIEQNPMLELLAPVSLNIVCFRFRCDDSDRVNQAIVTAVQRSGRVAPSSTRIRGVFAIRAAFFNHRTTAHHVDLLVEEVLRCAQVVEARHESRPNNVAA